jgi:drug/metabolite transporter (DMT)-like permease
MLSGIALLGLIYASVYWAETRMSSWLAGALYATSFLWAYLAECAAERRIPRSAIVLPILIGLAAIPLMLEPRSASRQELLPAMVVLVSAMLWSVMLVVLKRIQLPRNYRQTAALQLLAAGPFLIMVSRLSGEWLRVTHAWSFFAWKPIVGMIYLVFGASLISFSAFHWLLRHDRPSMVASSAYVNPVVALASGVLILHEECRPLQAAGAFLLVGSIATVWMLRESEAIRSIWKRYKLRASQNVSTSDCDVLAVTQPAVEEG